MSNFKSWSLNEASAPHLSRIISRLKSLIFQHAITSFAFSNLSIMSFAFITPASLKPFSPEAVAAITVSGSYSVNQESEFDSSSNGSEDEAAISDTESEESDDEEDERFQAISPNRLKGFSTPNADPDRVLSSFTSTGQRSLISRNSRKQLSLQAALGSFRTLPSSILCSTY